MLRKGWTLLPQRRSLLQGTCSFSWPIIPTISGEVSGSLMFIFLTHTKSNINSLELPASPVYAADPSASLMGAPSWTFRLTCAAVLPQLHFPVMTRYPRPWLLPVWHCIPSVDAACPWGRLWIVKWSCNLLGTYWPIDLQIRLMKEILSTRISEYGTRSHGISLIIRYG